MRVDALCQLVRLDLQQSGSVQQIFLHLQLCFHVAQASDGLDPADAGGDGAFAGDVETAHLGGVVQVGAAAQFHGVAAHVDHADYIPVLFGEQRHRAQLLGLVHGHLVAFHTVAFQDGLVDLLLNGDQLFAGDGGEVGEVEAQVIRIDQGAGLLDVVAQDVLEGSLEQVGGGVGTLDGLAAGGVHGSSHFLVAVKFTLGHFAVVQIFARLSLLGIGDSEHGVASGDGALVADLAAHFGVEGGLVQDDNALLAFHDGAAGFVSFYDGQDLAGVGELVIAGEHGGFLVHVAQVDALPTQVAQRLSCLTGTNLLGFHLSGEALLIHGHALVLAHFDGQVDGEAIGVIELEGVSAGEHGLALGLVCFQHFPKDLQTAIDGAAEALLLHLDDTGDVVPLLHQVGISALIFVDDGVADLIQEGTSHAQETAMPCGTAEQAAQHIAAAAVAGQDAIGDHHGSGADVVGDDTQGNIGLVALLVVGAGDLGDFVGDVHDRVHIEQGVHLLTDHGQTFQPHAGVDVLLLQLGVVVMAIVVELGEHVVPHFHIAVTVTAHRAIGFAAAVFFPTIVVDLGTGAAGASAMFPEVVLFAEPEDAVFGNVDVLIPDLKGFVIVQVDRGIETVGIQSHPVGRGQELPAPSDGFLLEVVTEGEVAQHFEIGAVPSSLADVFDVAGADALLTGADPLPGRGLVASEPGLHRRHTGVNEQQGCVILRDQRKAGQTQVILGFEEFQEHLS